MANPFQELTLNNLQRQFGYTNLSDLLMKRAAVWDKHYGEIAQTFNDEILNFDTCIPDALDNFWGKIYRITRNFEDDDGNVLTLTDDEFREVIKIRAFGSRWDGTIGQMNEFLNNLFQKRGQCYMLDPQSMTVEMFVFNFQLSDTELFLFTKKDILPRPAGVGVQILEINTDEVIGFYGTELQPLGQGVLFTGES